MPHRFKAGFAAAIAVLVIPASASAATKVVDMGTPPSSATSFQKLGADVNAFFPSTTTVHVGDKVQFVPVGFHNLDLPKKGGKPTALLAPTGQAIAGANDAAGQAFWFNGQQNIQFNFPTLAPKGFGKTFSYSGAKAVQSGLPLAAKPKPVTVKFTKSGSFTYYCDVHPGMKATVRVVKKFSKVPSAKAHAKLIKDQAKKELARAKNLAKTATPANTVDLGVAGKGGVEYFGMVPATTTVPAGTTVTFRMSPGTFEVHTATFGPGNIDDPKSFIGAIAASFEGANLDQSAVYPSDAPGMPSTVTPTTHGNGFWNSGALDGVSATTTIPSASQVTFTTPGTYTYYCLVHTNMKGTVVVQ